MTKKVIPILTFIEGGLQRSEVLFVIWWKKIGENLKLIFQKRKKKKSTEMRKNDTNNLRKSPQMCQLWRQRKDSYGSIPSCWPLKMSNILLSSLELAQDEFSATLSSPLPPLTGLKTTQSLLWRHSNLRTCSDVSFFVILFLIFLNEFEIRFSLVFFHHMRKSTSDRWSTQSNFQSNSVLSYLATWIPDVIGPALSGR